MKISKHIKLSGELGRPEYGKTIEYIIALTKQAKSRKAGLKWVVQVSELKCG